MNLNKKCRDCFVQLTTSNAAKKNAKYYRNECKSCRSKCVSKRGIGNPVKKAYAMAYARRRGWVTQHPCLTCQKLCYKRYAKAFCSDMCRFMSYVDKQSDCWIWTGAKNKRGYGKLCFKDNNSAIASRVSYELFKGLIDPGKLICHTCDIPLCVNPDHLWAGTHIENMMDMTEKGRQCSKISNVDAFRIRKLWESGYSQEKIIELYGITSGTISNIVKRRIWKHV